MKEKNSFSLQILAPVSAISRRTRLYKIVTHLHRKGWSDLSFCGWLRAPGEEEEKYISFPVRKRYLIKGGGYGGRVTRLLYLVWVIKAFFAALRFRRGSVIWALGWESAFPAVLASKIKNLDVIFDDADRFSLIFSLPGLLGKIIAALEKWTSHNSLLHLIPGIARYDFESGKFYELKNTPSAIEVQIAEDIYKKREWPRADLVINVNGWLGSDRGIPVICKVAKELQNENIKFIVAGKPDCQEALEFISLKNVEYIGKVSNAEALASYFASDYVFTYYNPKTKINRLAESNKWGDAIKIGVGVIVNSEVRTASYLAASEAGIFLPYEDVDALAENLRYLIKNKNNVTRHKENILKLSGRFDFFEDQLNTMFEGLKYGKAT